MLFVLRESPFGFVGLPRISSSHVRTLPNSPRRLRDVLVGGDGQRATVAVQAGAVPRSPQPEPKGNMGVGQK